ncbi:MAG: hypothetical protein QOJ63_2274 [Solirubrobacteraceae bacterium]|jgi:hypothetical protein|nr:hypothetical protein [Solirubrobacteraceae bacterium]
MRRLSTLALAALLAVALTAPAGAAFFLGDPLDGPSADVRALGDLDLARDGTGALVYVKAVDGADHVFVARFEKGIFQLPERVDGALAGPSSQPVVAASDAGRLAIVFVNAGTVYGVVRAAGQGFAAPVSLGTGVDPAVDLSINGTAFASFTAAGDVRLARLDRRTNVWTAIAQPADVDPARAAGVGTGRSKVAISADGIGIVTWGEAGRVFARKMFNEGISDAPQDLTPPSLLDRVATTSDLPDVDAEDDSSYAWVVFRQTFADGGSRILARRQRGTQFDPPVAIDTGDEPVRDPRIDLNGRGRAVAAMAGATSGQPMAALTDERDAFGVATRILTPTLAGPAAAPAISENNQALVAAILAGAGAAASVSVHPYVGDKPGPDVTLSRPELGPVDPKTGFEAASDRAGGTVVAWVQGAGADRRIVAGYFDRPPLRFAGYTTQRCCRAALPILTWGEAFNLWGPTRYEILVDGVLVGQSASTSLQLMTPLKGGTHTWQVRALDIRGGATRSERRLLRIDDRKPRLTVRYKRSKRVVTIAARARDDGRSGPLTSGLAGIVVSWGDRAPSVRGRFDVHATHRYNRNGTYPLTITASDVAGNVAVSTRTVRIG